MNEWNFTRDFKLKLYLKENKISPFLVVSSILKIINLKIRKTDLQNKRKII